MELREIFRFALKGDKETCLRLLDPYLKSTEISYTKLEAHIIHGFILNRVGQFSEVRDTLKVFPKYYSHIEQSFYRRKELNQKEIEIFSLYLLVKAFRNIKLGNLDESEILLEHASGLLNKINDKWFNSVISGIYYNEVGLLYWKIGKYDKSIKAHEKAITVLSLPVNEVLGIAYNDQAISYYENGEYLQSLKNLKTALPLLKENNSKQDYGYAIGNIGRVYRIMGDVERAKQYSIKSLHIKEEVGNKLDLAVELRNLALLSLHEENYNQSLDYLKRSLDLRLQMDNQIDIAESYYYLILLGIEWLDEIQLTKSDIMMYLSKLKKLAQNSDYKSINYQFKLAKTLFETKFKPYNTDLNTIYINLESISKETEIQSDIRLLSLVHICWLLIERLKSHRNKEDLISLRENMDILMKLAKNNNLFGLMIQTLILKSRFWFLENDLIQAKKMIAEAVDLSSKSSLSFLKEKVDQELIKYNGLLTRISSSNNDFDDSFKLLEVEEYLKSISSGLSMII